MGDAGFGTYRVPVNWAAVQRTKDGAYDWGQSDAASTTSAKHQMRPALVVYGTPDSSTSRPRRGSTGRPSKAGPEGVAEVHQGARRPLQPERRLLRQHPRDRSPPGQDLDHVERAEHEEQLAPEGRPARVRASSSRRRPGDLQGGPECQDRARRDVRVPARPEVDEGREVPEEALQGHAASPSISTRSTPTYGSGVRDVKKQIGELRSVASKAGDGNVGLIVGELGWASSGPSRSESVVGKKGQAKRLKDGLELLARKRNAWNVGSVFVYAWKDFPGGQLACLWCPHAGLVKKHGKAKPALHAVKKVIRKKG